MSQAIFVARFEVEDDQVVSNQLIVLILCSRHIFLEGLRSCIYKIFALRQNAASRLIL